MFINQRINTGSIQQDTHHMILKLNQPKNKNTASETGKQEEKKQPPKRAIKYAHLIGIIIF